MARGWNFQLNNLKCNQRSQHNDPNNYQWFQMINCFNHSSRLKPQRILTDVFDALNEFFLLNICFQFVCLSNLLFTWNIFSQAIEGRFRSRKIQKARKWNDSSQVYEMMRNRTILCRQVNIASVWSGNDSQGGGGDILYINNFISLFLPKTFCHPFALKSYLSGS